MNLLLLTEQCLRNEDLAEVTGRQFDHLTKIKKLAVGDQLAVGLLNGPLGQGKVLKLTSDSATLQLELNTAPPAPLPLTVLLALPRPQMIKRILQTIAGMGVKHLILMGSTKVERSFWQSPALEPAAIHEQLILGLEQAVDTALPRVDFEPRFKFFVEDRLAALTKGKRCFIPHPGDFRPCPTRIGHPSLVAIGPEGGWLPSEVDRFTETGFEAVSMGRRILKTEIAVPVIISNLYPNGMNVQ